ncbi:MAG: amidophosphoribosyltransferase [Betaproteobacteria bacterium]|jgi:amidophosphoribosyltransferase|nr:amidophosphoribosyltransferase [Betaproteobacteria bacterium]NBS93153.1 amidophosphoribosyltransferase [Betaproteobacteria bacterium]NBY53008.1 amidophosphoribosyltransferase [Betaproteobacteria bacterium]NCA24099.1 amidophosphoribosyltransferase [Betaproteobacteria bacterium]NCU85139.1 amidophosphoribosyltransferase [Betaproteobacteria bacterium]
MCGILGVVARAPVNQLLYDGLQVLQHRGQDAAGICTVEDDVFHMHKGPGLVRDVFRTRDMRNLRGTSGLAHVRYPTAGSAKNPAEAQPFYVNSPFGIVLAHNGNLTNTAELKDELFRQDLRHLNTNSDSELLLNVLAHELAAQARGAELDVEGIFAAVREVHRRCRGAYAVVAMIAGYGLLAFRDPHGVRPLVYGSNMTDDGVEYLVASESVALDTLGFSLVRDINAGEALFIDFNGSLYTRQCSDTPTRFPCLFEFVYFARPDSVIDGLSVYKTRLAMGQQLAVKMREMGGFDDIDVVIPIPDSSRPSAMELARHLGLDYREGFVKNRYIGRTFIMPGQASRKKSVRQKLNAIASEFEGKNVLLVDDSIVRGTTSREIVQMARDSGARKVYFASAAPPVRYPNVYGIDMPTRDELIASGRDDAQIATEIGVDRLVYQDIESLFRLLSENNQQIDGFEASCFTGCYLTGDITPDYLEALHASRGADSAKAAQQQLDLTLATTD